MFARHLAAVCLLALSAALGSARADPALWVARSASATVYLFGTIHVLPKGLVWLDPRIRSALAASSELWTEADVSNLAAAVGAIRRYGLGEPQATETLLPSAYRARYRQQISRTGISPVLLAKARPWLAEILLSTAAMQQAGPLALGAESTLITMARARHIATPTFETLDDQFALLANMPIQDQLASLEEQIDDFDRARPIFDQMLAAWRAGDQDRLDSLINQDMRDRSAQVWTVLILRRNQLFARRIAERLHGAGTAFVAVGAGHLCGAEGVPKLLARDGFSVTRLQ
jgi:uncharacterized protein YbaP (TraB family)